MTTYFDRGQADIENYTKPGSMNGVNFDVMTLDQMLDMPVHPIAAMFPMMDDDGLKELAEDISKNGVLHPVVFDPSGVLIDGRNRLAACKIAGVVPPVKVFEGGDPVAAIISENINRRHLTKSQRAMALAVAYPEPSKGGRGKKNSLVAKEFSGGQLSQARTILSRAPDLIDIVLAGGMSVEAAYQKARERMSAEEEAVMRVKSLARVSPELAEAVSNGLMEIDAAEKALKEQERQRRQRRFDATKNILEAVAFLNMPVVQASEYAEIFDPEICESLGGEVTPEILRRVSAFVSALADGLEARL